VSIGALQFAVKPFTSIIHSYTYAPFITIRIGRRNSSAATRRTVVVCKASPEPAPAVADKLGKIARLPGRQWGQQRVRSSRSSAHKSTLCLPATCDLICGSRP
jgi:hypothetical protein